MLAVGLIGMSTIRPTNRNSEVEADSYNDVNLSIVSNGSLTEDGKTFTPLHHVVLGR